MRGIGGPDPNVAALRDLGHLDVLSEARERFRACAEWESTYRNRFMEDLKFAEADSFNGYQWPDSIRHTRDLADRPCLTLNVVRQHNLKIINDMKRSKESCKVMGMGNGATQESANVLKNIIRHIEYTSKAQRNAYTVARNFQVKCGIGWWRLITDYESNDSFDQEIYIEGVPDPLSVFMDPDCQKADCSDGRYAFVFSFLPRDLVQALVPDYPWEVGAPKMPIGIAPGESFFIEKDHWLVCEYFRKVPIEDKLISFVTGAGERLTIKASLIPPSVRQRLLDDDRTMSRRIVDQQIEWKLIVGDEIVDETIWPGSFIPLIRVLGEETVIEGILDRKGHTRALQDAQRMFNYNALLALDTSVPVVDGWVTVGELETGDWVFGQDGKPVQIKEALPIHYNEECFRITFDNGETIVTDAGHIWKVEERAGRTPEGFVWNEVTRATIELEPKKHFIVMAEPLRLDNVELPIHPYLLGVWLGNGQASGSRIYAHVDDIDEFIEIISGLGLEVSKSTWEWPSLGACFSVYGLRGLLDSIGVLKDKHIPIRYRRASYRQRLALLQGLMDTDGHFASAVNQCIFSNTNRALLDGVRELCASLGIKTTMRKEAVSGKGSDRCYRVQFTADCDMPVFRLERKAERQQRARTGHWRRTKRIGIKSIEPVASVPTRCITLDSPEHLFLVGSGMIPTHNSAQVEFGALQTKAPWVAPAASIEGLEGMWNTANTENHSVLIWKHVDDDNPEKDIPPPMRTDPPQLAPAFQEGMNTAFMQMMMTSGQWQNQQGQMGNERTGAAIEQRLQQGDVATYHFVDNYEDALVYTYQQIIDLIPKVYDTRRIKHVMADDGIEMEITLDPGLQQAYLQQQDADNTIIARIFNPQLGKYEVAADVGPNLMSRRREAVEALTTILTEAPGLTAIVGDIMIRNMEFDDAQEAAMRMRRMVPPQALGQGPNQNEQMQQQTISQLQSALAQSIQRQGRAELRLAGKDQMRDIDVYEAETKRIQALAPLLPTDASGLQQLIEQLVSDALETNLMPVLKANIEGVAEQSAGVDQGGGTGAGGPAAAGGAGAAAGAAGAPTRGQGRGQGGSPPIPGAQQGNDGEWYILDPTRRGRYLRIGPLATQRPAGR